MIDSVEKSQLNLYTAKYVQHGDDPQALSWNDRSTQFLRFEKITKLFDHEADSNFSVHEVGCGLGHFNDYLHKQGLFTEYSGNDIVPQFIEHCRKRYPTNSFTQISIALDLERLPASMKDKDYYCLNGTFHTKENNSEQAWEEFVFKSLKNMYALANKGVCVNFLTSHADFYNSNLYYVSPSLILDWCTRNLSRFVTIAHDVPLYEFFVYIYKPEFMKKVYPAYAERYIKTEGMKHE